MGHQVSAWADIYVLEVEPEDRGDLDHSLRSGRRPSLQTLSRYALFVERADRRPVGCPEARCPTTNPASRARPARSSWSSRTTPPSSPAWCARWAIGCGA